MKDAKQERLIQSGWRGWLKLFGVWSIPVVVAASAFLMQSAYAEETRPPFAWFLVQNWVWYLWAILCPWAYHLVVRYPSGKLLWRRGVPLHLLTGILSSALILATYGVFRALQYNTGTWWEGAIANMTRAGSVGNYLQTTVIYGLVAGGMYAVYSSRLRRVRDAESATLVLRTAQLEAQLASAQLQSLQMQLQPHFLFNALNSIASLVDQKRNDEAFQMISLLGELLRASLDRTEHHSVPLHEEIELLNRYLEIERVRFSDRLQCEISVPKECCDAQVPVLLLQPLVENAIRHAMNQDPGAGHIEISAQRQADSLLLRVRDDGPGLAPGWTLQTGAGVGLANTAQRLQVHFGEKHKLQVQNTATQGVEVRIVIPFTSVPMSSPSLPTQPATATLSQHQPKDMT